MFHHLLDIYADSYGGGPGKTLGQLTDETHFRVVRHIPYFLILSIKSLLNIDILINIFSFLFNIICPAIG